jgi:hypothetical protein
MLAKKFIIHKSPILSIMRNCCFTENIKNELPKCKTEENKPKLPKDFIEAPRAPQVYTNIENENQPVDENLINRDSTTDQLGKTLGESRYHEKDKVEFLEEKNNKEKTIKKPSTKF